LYPNPQDVLPLPPQPDLAQYRKRAKDLTRACKLGGSEPIAEWATRWVHDLASAQQMEMREGLDVWAARSASQVAEFAQARLLAAECSLTQAQFVIARAHGFESWPRFAAHIESLTGQTGTSSFEQAADAIVEGDRATLARLLKDDPTLIRATSTREHHASLLHYVSANGVENFRQETPGNIVEMAQLLLDAGAEVDAEAEVYGGGATTLGLVVTSAHPREAGVQLALAELLLNRGARMSRRLIRDCLMNGCPEAAEYLASRGAYVGLLEASGLGRGAEVHRFILEQKPTHGEMVEALMMAAWYGRVEVAEALLDSGVAVGVPDDSNGEGQTALHIAAYAGHRLLVDSLVRRGAPLDVADKVYKTPPLVWALHAWLVENRKNTDEYKAIVKRLVDAGATVQADWIDDDRIRSDPDLSLLLKKAIGGRS
jgi:hypothetical protein